MILKDCKQRGILNDQTIENENGKTMSDYSFSKDEWEKK